MLQNAIANSCQSSYIGSTYSTHGNITSYNNYDTFPLATGINSVINSTEINIKHTLPCALIENDNHDDYLHSEWREGSESTGYLKRLLAGVSALTGIGVLAIGCHKASYMKEKAMGDKNAHSPYTYYEDLYSTRAAQYEASRSTESKFNAQGTPPLKYNHSADRDDYYKATSVYLSSYEYIQYPAGKKIQKALSTFCILYVEGIVIKSNKATPKRRDELLRSIHEMYKKHIIVDKKLRDENARKCDLTVAELAEDIIARRKLAILLLAAEYITQKKNSFSFYSSAMDDNKNYTIGEILDRWESMINYQTE